MKTLQGSIAKRANAEDGVKGRFFEGRFKSQILLSQNAILAAMAYVDLNPVRAKMVGNLGKSKNTGIKLRMKKISKNQTFPHELLASIAGLATFQLPMSPRTSIEPPTDRVNRATYSFAGGSNILWILALFW